MMLRKWLLGLILFGITQASANPEIANGKIIPETTFPEVVKIYSTYGKQGASCTATIVGHNTLLTAAHCLYFFGPKAEEVEIVKGSHEGLQSLNVFIHPKFSFGRGFNDVALIKFEDKSFTNHIQISLTLPSTGQEFTIVGYGKFSFYSNTSDGKKRMGTNKLTSIGRRFDFTGYHENKGPDGLGTGQNVSNLPGDSGGPMLVNGKVIGVSSSIDTALNDQNEVVGHYENLLFDENFDFLRNSAQDHGLHLSGLNL